MPKALKYLLLVLAVPLALVFVWDVLSRATDPDLDPELQAMMREFDEPLPGNGYYALLGFGRIGDTPMAEVGEKLVAWERTHRGYSTPEVLAGLGIEFDKISGETRAAVCYVEQAGHCLEHAAANRAAIQDMAARRAKLLDEYRSLYDYTVFRYPYLPSFDSSMPSFPMAMFCSALLRTQAALLILDRKAEAAVPVLVRDIEFWRRHLAQPRTALLDKLVTAAVLQTHAAMFSELLHEKRLGAGEASRIAAVLGPLSPAEHALYPSLQVEAGTYARGTLDQSDVERGRIGSDWLGAPDWAAPLLAWAFFQPHATANRMFRHVKVYAGADALSGAELKAQLATAHETFEERGWAQRWFNPAGDRFERAATPSYLEYFLRLRDLDGYLRAVSLQARIAAQGVPDAGIPEFIAKAGAGFSDPFDGAPMRWDAQARTLNFAAQGKRVQALLPLRL